jgi:hypothetical protein
MAADAEGGIRVGLEKLSARAESSASSHKKKLSCLDRLVRNFECELLAYMNFSGSLGSGQILFPVPTYFATSSHVV